MTETKKNVLFGAIAGVSSRIVISPLDIIKIRIQVDFKNLPKYSSISSTLLSILREEGVLAFWKGNSAALLLYASYSAIQFSVFDRLENIPTFVSGAIAGFIATTCTYPFDILRTKFALRKNRDRPLTILKLVAAQEGITGFYRGLTPTLVQIVPYMSIVFYSQKIYAEKLNGFSFGEFLGGAMAGVTGRIACSPLDVIRKRLQASDSLKYVLDVDSYSSFKDCAIKIYHKEGLRAFYRGLGASCLKAAPASAISFYVYRKLQKSFP